MTLKDRFDIKILQFKKLLGTQTALLDWPDAPITIVLNGLTDRMRIDPCRKEPETAAWLRANMKPGKVLYDVGANVGGYSLIAARIAGGDARIYAFEPSFSTFATLSQNILLNKFERSITPILVALGAENGFLSLNFSSVESGAAKHSVVGARAAAGPALAVPSITLDTLRELLKLPAPNLLKIDVDGGEWEVVQGARQTLMGKELASVLIEIDLSDPHGPDIEKFFLSLGFTLAEKHPRHKGTSNTLFNYIFKK